jgi:hypothetical protein
VKAPKVKPIIFLTIAVVFGVVAILSGNATNGFIAAVIALVCGLLGVLHLKG